MRIHFIGRRKHNQERILKTGRSGILFLEGVSSDIGVSKITVFLKRYGDIKRIFFFNSSRSFGTFQKKVNLYVVGIVEFTKKINAKRVPLLIKIPIHQSGTEIPFEKAFYLKRTNWKKLVEFLK